MKNGKLRGDIVALIESGVAYADISRQLECAKSTVTYYATKHLGREPKGSCGKRYDWVAIVSYINNGHTPREAREYYGFSSWSWYAAQDNGLVPVGLSFREKMGRLPRPAGYYTERHRKRMTGAKLAFGDQCQQCGSKERLEFDHIDPDLMSFRVSALRSSLDSFREELKKCQLLCRKCHWEKTLKDKGWNSGTKHGTTARYDRGHCRCDECKLAKSVYNKAHKSSRKRLNNLLPS